MATTIKATKVQKFQAIRSMLPDTEYIIPRGVVAEGEPETIILTREDMVAFIDHEIEILSKKNSTKSNKPSKTAQENEPLKADVLDYLTEVGEPVRANDVFKNVPSVNAVNMQKATSILTALVKAGLVKNEKLKGISWYSLV